MAHPYQMTREEVEWLRAIAEGVRGVWASAIIDELSEPAAEHWPISEADEKWASHAQLTLAAIAFGAKCSTSLDSVLLLNRCERGNDAMAITRTMVEALGKLAYITGPGWPKRFYEFRVSMALHDEAQWNALIKHDSVKPLASAGAAKHIDDFLIESRNQLGNSAVNEIARKWPPGGVRQALQSVRLLSLYDAWYRTGSRTAHANDILDYATWSEESGFEVNPAGRWGDMALAGAAQIAIDVFHLCGTALGLHLDLRLKAYLIELELLARQR